MSREYNPHATYKTACGHVLSNIQLTRKTKPSVLESLAANLAEMMGFDKIGPYKVTNVIGTGQHMCDGKPLWTHTIKGANGFQKITPKA